MRTGSKKLNALLKAHPDLVEVENNKKHWVIKVQGQRAAVISHGTTTKFRTMKNTEARVVRALRSAGVKV